ncbi:BamA/TamA family outer membrane protein [Vibrio sp. SS-MA-C1-2]|uniref:BamA/TamA family outer membrane protein n=1 Tax=Vibrio sp. SS-MA-C1-2 TaxID=2908646 RepID=UPI001F2F8EDF|nr:BamA/TamA family outer membrane protein [Vibrio sp. SS-MA-C1-2]UJF19548.1 BamA/TamA family outer membrane protein [Vibrio sp. SS-MA-C1-2]
MLIPSSFKRLGALFLLLAISMPALSNSSDSVAKDLDVTDSTVSTAGEKDSKVAAVPFFYTSDTMGFTTGVAGVVKGAGQPQASLLGVGLVSTNKSWLSYLNGSNYLISRDVPWLFSAELMASQFNEYDYYIGSAGSNSSDKEDATFADGREGFAKLSARYILPIGNVEDHNFLQAMKPQRQFNGLNPLDSGVTSFLIKPFYEYRDLGEQQPQDQDTESLGVELMLDIDSRDDIRNPTQGYRTQLITKHGMNDNQDWWTWVYNQSAYWSLGELGNLFDQQTLAFNVYTGDTPTWNKDGGRPPDFAGLKLGGLYRLRSFSGGRFHDRSVLSYSAEYRVIPEWQPLEDWPVFNWYDIPWWEWVLFIDAGGVADQYDFAKLNQDMHWSAGGGVRLQVEGVVVRAGVSWGEEGSSFKVMVNQPF